METLNRLEASVEKESEEMAEAYVEEGGGIFVRFN
jgi:hypothetical protein